METDFLSVSSSALNAKTNYAERRTLDHLLRESGPVYLAISSTDPDESGLLVEPTPMDAPDYVRPLATFTPAATDGTGLTTSANAAVVTFASSAATAWGTFKTVAAMDAPTGGNALYVGLMDQPIVVAIGDPVTVPAGALICAED